jgi:hypothetical protein
MVNLDNYPRAQIPGPRELAPVREPSIITNHARRANGERPRWMKNAA